jgi:hypothetical protein
MMLSLFVTLGIFLLIAARNPSANRSLIAFTASSSLAHGAVIVVVAVYMASERAGLLCPRCHRRSADCADSGKAFRRPIELAALLGKWRTETAFKALGVQ